MLHIEGKSPSNIYSHSVTHPRALHWHSSLLHWQNFISFSHRIHARSHSHAPTPTPQFVFCDDSDRVVVRLPCLDRFPNSCPALFYVAPVSNFAPTPSLQPGRCFICAIDCHFFAGRISFGIFTCLRIATKKAASPYG